MNLFDVSIKIIENFLDTHDTIPKIVDKIKSKGSGKIAFFPCSRYANNVIRHIKENEAELFAQIEGIYDMSMEAKSDTGVPVFHISKIVGKRDTLSFVVICSNTYHEREVSTFKQETGYTGDFVRSSYFDISLPQQSKEEILADIKTIYNMLADEKSRAVYMITWLSKTLNDETYTYLFENEENIKINGQETKYKGYTIKNIGDVCAAELYAEIYKMRYVYPEKGDTVLDIGGYKGDTAIFFADSVGKEGRIYVFEPTLLNFRILKENIRLNNLDNIIIPINMGISDKSGSMKATTIDSGAPWSFISENQGNEDVKVTTIDDFVAEQGVEKVDFIKMDVEGVEYEVISGGNKTISEHRPKLAIPLYHKVSDLTVLPLFIKRLADYKIYMRCKIEGPFGITMYCHPQE